MAGKNPSEFDSITEEQLAPEDRLMVWDASAGRLKQIAQAVFGKASALANYYTKAQSDERYLQSADISGLGTGDMLGTNNLSELTNIGAAKTKLELDRVDNTADLDKPISTATAAALALKLDAASYNDRHKGTYLTLAALQAAHPSASVGDTAQVDSGTGSALHVYGWDAQDGWVLISADGTGATNTDQLPEGSTNLYFTAARVLAAVSGLFQPLNTLLTNIAALSGTGFLKLTGGIPSITALSTSDISGLGTAATQASADFATAAQGIKADNALQKDGSVTATGNLDMGNNKITNYTAHVTAVTGAQTVGQSFCGLYYVTGAGGLWTLPGSGFTRPITFAIHHDGTGNVTFVTNSGGTIRFGANSTHTKLRTNGICTVSLVKTTTGAYLWTIAGQTEA